MDLFTCFNHEEFGEELSVLIPCKAKSNSQAYGLLLVNELLHLLGMTTEDNYSTLYAMITDSDVFTEF